MQAVKTLCKRSELVSRSQSDPKVGIGIEAVGDNCWSFCAVIQRIVCSYQVSRDPGSLDLLIYQVYKLLRILIAVTCARLTAVGKV